MRKSTYLDMFCILKAAFLLSMKIQSHRWLLEGFRLRQWSVFQMFRSWKRSRCGTRYYASYLVRVYQKISFLFIGTVLHCDSAVLLGRLYRKVVRVYVYTPLSFRWLFPVLCQYFKPPSCKIQSSSSLRMPVNSRTADIKLSSSELHIR